MARGKGPASLGEIMGKMASDAVKVAKKKFTVNDLSMLLGELTPKVEFTMAGKNQLLRMLQQRFGGDFRKIPEVGDVMKDFDTEMGVRRVIRQNITSRKLGGK